MLKKKLNRKYRLIIKKYKIKNLFITITIIKYTQNKSKKLIKEENDFNESFLFISLLFYVF